MPWLICLYQLTFFPSIYFARLDSIRHRGKYLTSINSIYKTYTMKRNRHFSRFVFRWWLRISIEFLWWYRDWRELASDKKSEGQRLQEEKEGKSGNFGYENSIKTQLRYRQAVNGHWQLLTSLCIVSTVYCISVIQQHQNHFRQRNVITSRITSRNDYCLFVCRLNVIENWFTTISHLIWTPS